MAFTLDIVIPIGITGLTDLRAQLFDNAGNVGSAVTTGFTERGTSGNYLWHYTAWPDGHTGGVEFYSNADPTSILAVASINPQEAEYTDVKVSAVKIKTDNLPSDPADASDIAASFATVNTKLDTIDDLLDTEIAAISANVAAILDDTGTAGVVISSATMQALADVILSRGVSNVEGSADLGSIAELLLGMFESEADNSTWVIYRTDHITIFNTRTITTSGAALPVTEVD